MRLERRNIKNRGRSRAFSGTALIAYLLIAVALTTGVTFSRYTSQSTSDDSAKVAAFVFDVSDGDGVVSLNVEELNQPGTQLIYEIDVTNEKGSAVSEVKQEYTITVDTTHNLPLEYTLTEKDGSTASDLFKSGLNHTASFNAAEKATHEYELTITWPEEENNENLADEIEYIKLIVHCEQVD